MQKLYEQNPQTLLIGLIKILKQQYKIEILRAKSKYFIENENSILK